MQLQDYRAEVRRNYEATEQIFAADMKWRDDWLKDRKKERRKERRAARRDQPGNGDVRTSPTEEQPADLLAGDSSATVDVEKGGRLPSEGGAVDVGGGGRTSGLGPVEGAVDVERDELNSRLPPMGSGVDVEEGGITSELLPAVTGQTELDSNAGAGYSEGLAVSSTGEAISHQSGEFVSRTGAGVGTKSGEVAPNAPTLSSSGQDFGLRGEEGTGDVDSPQDETRGPCQGSCLAGNIKGSEDD